MKNYDIKNATVELSIEKKISIKVKRIAFLVPNMFSKLRSGFAKKASLLKKSMVSIKQGTAEPIAQAVSEAKVVREEAIEQKVAKIDEKIERKEDAMVQAKSMNNINDNVKSYVIKAYESEIERLYKRKARVSTSPRRLLISTVFLQKLIVNRKRKFVANLAQRQEMKVEEKELKNLVNNLEDVSNAPKKVSTVDEAKTRYIELNNKRLELVEQEKKIREQLTKLVQEFGLTKDMFTEEMGKTK